MRIPQGAIVAMLTPFDDSGRISEPQVRKLVDFLISKGVNGIFPVASCGEYTHLDMSERKFLIDIVLDEAGGRVDVIPGTGATCHTQSIELASYARERGCAGIVLHGPYFFKNTDEVIEGHLRKVAEAVDIPVFLYNIPFFANEVTPAMVERLCSIPNVVGVKESSGNMVNVMNILEMTRKIKPDFKVMLGAEEIFLPSLLMGAKGCMTAICGVLPEFAVGIYKAFLDGNFSRAFNLQMAILPIIREMKTVNFPQGFKEAMSLRGIDMGRPKMNYPPAALEKIAALKERLKLEMTTLLSTYFPEADLKYDSAEKSAKNIYPYLSPQNVDVKKHAECSCCGMCGGDRCNDSSKNNVNTVSNTVGIIKNNTLEPFAGKNLNGDDLESLISSIVKNVIEKTK
jgi:dihydrodipicolinate synthase/N-acetylneuraminate lyase